MFGNQDLVLVLNTIMGLVENETKNKNLTIIIDGHSSNSPHTCQGRIACPRGKTVRSLHRVFCRPSSAATFVVLPRSPCPVCAWYRAGSVVNIFKSTILTSCISISYRELLVLSDSDGPASLDTASEKDLTRELGVSGVGDVILSDVSMHPV